MHQTKQLAFVGVLALTALSACDSDSDDELNSQAIDGYIVGASVFCDGDAYGATLRAGHLTCPGETSVVSVRGGVDVGFDAEATTSDLPFIGELLAPADLAYVTPLSTIAVHLSSSGGSYDPQFDTFDPERWEASVEELALVLNEPSLDLTTDASEDMSQIRLNAQIHKVLSAFTTSEADYLQASSAMARVVAGRASIGAVVSLDSDVSGTLTAISASLQENFSPLALSASEIERITPSLLSANREIALATTPTLVAATASTDSVNSALATIDRNNQAVLLDGRSQYSINDFENASLRNGQYVTQVSSGLSEVGYDIDMLEFDRDLEDVQVTMAFELKSTQANDARSLSFVSDEIYLSAMADRPGSLTITLPDEATFEAVGINSRGTVTSAEILIDGEDTLSSEGGYFNVNFGNINSELEGLGFEDILEQGSNYTLTLIISGIHLDESSSGENVPATRYTVNVGSRVVTGAGFKGYVSYTN